MSKNQTIKEIISEKINQEQIYQQVIQNRKKRIYDQKGLYKIAFTLCIIFLLSLAVTSTLLAQRLKTMNFSNSVKIYSMAANEENKPIKKEFQENVKLVLEQYNLAMSMVPGYPISFAFNEENKLDYMQIQVINGEISDWNQTTGDLRLLNNPYQISANKTLYFKIAKESTILVTGYYRNKKVIAKKITIKIDDDFNLYGIMK